MQGGVASMSCGQVEIFQIDSLHQGNSDQAAGVLGGIIGATCWLNASDRILQPRYTSVSFRRRRGRKISAACPVQGATESGFKLHGAARSGGLQAVG